MTTTGVIAGVISPPGTGHLIASRGAAYLARGTAAAPDLPPKRTSAVVYGPSAVDDRGRLADRVVLRALSWPVGRRLDIRGSRPCRQHQVTGQGHVRIPAVLRHRCGLATGDRVLLGRPRPVPSRHLPTSPSSGRTCPADLPRVRVLLNPDHRALGHPTAGRADTIGDQPTRRAHQDTRGHAPERSAADAAPPNTSSPTPLSEPARRERRPHSGR
jgi:hypothetical protein